MSENGTTSRAAEQHRRVIEALQRIVEPVRAEIEQIDARLAELNAERDELNVAKREAMAVLRAADPKEREKAKAHYGRPGPRKGEGNQRRSVQHQREVTAKVEKFLRTNPTGNGDGYITANWVAGELAGMSVPTARKALEELVDSGLIRTDRKVRGGGLAYALVNDGEA